MIIDKTYFNDYIIVPVAVAPNSNLLGDDKLLNDTIKKYEPIVLADILGYQNFKDLSDHLSDSSGKWSDLLNGKEYDSNGHPVKWRGLKYKDDDVNRSLLADYIYYEYLKAKASTLSSVGLITNDAKNSKRVNSNERLVTAWNSFVSQVQGNNQNFVSLYQFLSDHTEDYGTPNVKMYEHKNRLGL
jgi:hypothetical protein